ncbi:hypothetical protein LVB77_01720 [Lysobacter sp. 5GHs7-4]|uniref:hypothetical protein n=1 Tax=Lysobacter sp. 5GHs7-4 TaxID=2904253 RepID=UPI001E513764|nr:hypothetical protein [Lysobacter sp. 5GHs7-4]UHQ23457.1 hypothetical protein LVB77_01720 [Lysobacter sp. 5GHs7-4]
MTAERHPGYALLLRWPFLLALGLLILNDTVLKGAWHNAFTGKLSDFAGVFAFAWFWSVAIGRARTAIHVAVAVAFAWWKSPWSAGAIEAWNGLPLFDVARVVDYGDLLALAVLPLSWWCLARPSTPARGAKLVAPWPQLAVALVAIVAFTATSRATTKMTVEDGIVYLAPLSPDAMLQRSVESSHNATSDSSLYPLVFSWTDCEVVAEFELRTTGAMTQMSLRRFLSRQCDVRAAPLSELFLAMEPELRSRLGARLLKPYTIPSDAVFQGDATSDESAPNCANPSSPAEDAQCAQANEAAGNP